MVARFIKALPTTVASISALASSFPKVVFEADGSRTVLLDLGEQTAAVGGFLSTDVVWEVAEDLNSLVFGEDFDTCVLYTPSRKTILLKNRIAAPVLSFSAQTPAEEAVTDGVFNGNPVLSWTSSYQAPTRIYRTAVYLTGSPLSEFTLIAELPGESTAGTPSIYLDNTTTLTDETDSVSYFVDNANGTSNILEFTGPVA